MAQTFGSGFGKMLAGDDTNKKSSLKRDGVSGCFL